MIYDKTTEGLEVEALSLRAARRGMEVAMVGVGSGIGAMVVRVPARLPEAALPIILSVVGVGTLLFGALLFYLWRSPPAAMVRKSARQIASRRAAGKPVELLSRPALVPLAVLTFSFAYWLVGRIPIAT